MNEKQKYQNLRKQIEIKTKCLIKFKYRDAWIMDTKNENNIKMLLCDHLKSSYNDQNENALISFIMCFNELN